MADHRRSVAPVTGAEIRGSGTESESLLTGSRLLPLRLGAFYAAYFCIIGTLMPYWPLFLQGRGLSPEEIGLVAAAPLWVKLLANPIAAGMVEKTGAPRTVILVLSGCAIVVFSLYSVINGVIAILLLSIVAGLFYQPLIPISDSLTIRVLALARLPKHGIPKSAWLDYGRLRLWGSLSFILVSFGAGVLLERLPTEGVLWLLIGFFALTFLGGAFLPDLRSAPRLARSGNFRRLMTSKPFVLFLCATGFLNGSHAMVYGFGTLHWEAAGLDKGTIGLLWAEGVIAEIALFAVGDRLVRGIGPIRLLMLAGAAGCLRWGLTGVSSELWVLILAQSLHGITFGALHQGAIGCLRFKLPPEVVPSAQALYSSLPMGIALGLGLPLSGQLYEALDGMAFFAMIGMSGVGMAFTLALWRRETLLSQPSGSPETTP